LRLLRPLERLEWGRGVIGRDMGMARHHFDIGAVSIVVLFVI
jgi:hypothetical protein